ncbi:hypothetical protein [Pleurocapsa sp. PCC 7319]|uniref:hypothetical protein n=1 Tax=Pleurocapsa sp. PCC 7319 TaxID=118161 RepID=UPI00034BD465|nr:hypothetical protein [Pleurocapsa sp. PCC 7319]
MSKINNLQHHRCNHKPIGSYLVESGLVSQDRLLQALEEQEKTEERIGDILVRQGDIKQKTLDYFIKNIFEPEQIQNRQHNLSNELKIETSNSFSVTSDRLTKTLSLPTLDLSPQKVCRLLLIIVTCLIIVSSLAQFGAFFLNQSSSANYSGRLFRLDEEINIPTLYSSLALAFCSILLAIISYLKKVIDSRYTGYWRALSLIFLYLAVDEMCSIHEILSALRPVLNAGGFLYFTWVVPGSILVMLFLLIFWKFIQSLPRRTRNLFIIAGTIYVGGAIGMEMIGGYHSEAYGEENPMYALITTIEESLEMFGIVVFVYALLSYIASYLRVVNLQVSFQKNKKTEIG